MQMRSGRLQGFKQKGSIQSVEFTKLLIDIGKKSFESVWCHEKPFTAYCKKLCFVFQCIGTQKSSPIGEEVALDLLGENDEGIGEGLGILGIVCRT